MKNVKKFEQYIKENWTNESITGWGGETEVEVPEIEIDDVTEEVEIPEEEITVERRRYQKTKRR